MAKELSKSNAKKAILDFFDRNKEKLPNYCMEDARIVMHTDGQVHIECIFMADTELINTLTAEWKNG